MKSLINEQQRCWKWCLLLACILALLNPLSGNSAASLLAWYKMDGNGEDALGRSPDMTLLCPEFAENTLKLTTNCTPYYNASARISGLSYRSFAVSFDFIPYEFGPYGSCLISGGPGYRWFGFHLEPDGHLNLTLNNWNRVHHFTNIVTSNQWHTLACSVDVSGQRIETILDGERLQPISLINFDYEVIGTDSEKHENVFCFWNGANATFFIGQVDDLKVYSASLSTEEITFLYAAKLSFNVAKQTLMVHWPDTLTGYVLQTADSLKLPLVWRNVPDPPVTIENRQVIVDHLTHAQKYYRLMRP